MQVPLSDFLDKVQRIAAFSDGETGGNPAGVLIADTLPDGLTMLGIAAEIGYSETAFAAPIEGGWRVRYFAPAMEVPFCGHATIALGAALASRFGDGTFALTLNDAQITVEGRSEAKTLSAALQSPPTHSRPADPTLIEEALTLFDYTHDDLDRWIPPAIAEAGATHLVLALNDRARLVEMGYDFDDGKAMMTKAGLTTITLAWPQTPQLFHTRNPFASGGVYEDAATGAASAALAGYLRDIAWPHNGAIDIIQGEDMGMRSLIHCDIPPGSNSSIRVSGSARLID